MQLTYQELMGENLQLLDARLLVERHDDLLGVETESRRLPPLDERVVYLQLFHVVSLVRAAGMDHGEGDLVRHGGSVDGKLSSIFVGFSLGFFQMVELFYCMKFQEISHKKTEHG